VDGAVERVFDGRYFGSPIPSGVITMWSGAISEIPGGWTLCDGTDGTPDLTDRFVAGAGGQYSVGDAGGSDSVQLTEAEMPGHTHDTQIHTNLQSSGQSPYPVTAGETDGVIESSSAGGDEAHENRPPYYALAYIQKV
jgi:microcystin-dependent protein